MKRWTVYMTILAVFAILALPAMAAKGGKGGGRGATSDAAATYTLNLAQASPRYGDTVSFNVVASTAISEPMIRIFCYQQGAWVFQLAGPAGGSFQLGGEGVSSGWSGGAANCTADLYHFIYQGKTPVSVEYFAATEFDVAA